MTARNILMSSASSSSTTTTYVDDVFNTYLYTGTGSTQTINNGIDLAGKGGLVWTKIRSVGNNILVDTVRGTGQLLKSNTTDANVSNASFISAFNSNGYNTGSALSSASDNFVSWTFRKAPKFFDIVTYTGNGVNNRAISHNLGTAPGMIILKNTSATGPNWVVYHRSLGATQYVYLNRTDAAGTYPFWADTEPTASNFYVSNAQPETNTNGSTYVAYLFAHDTAADGLIQCGTYTTDASGNADISLGWEPQFVITKCSSSVDQWWMFDNMRGMHNGNPGQSLAPNSSAAESSASLIYPSATGFKHISYKPNSTFVYITIRRSNKPPTSGTQVFSSVARAGTGASSLVLAGFPVDLSLIGDRGATFDKFLTTDRLRGQSVSFETRANFSEFLATNAFDTNAFANNSGIVVGTANDTNSSSTTYINYLFKRASGFFDMVCYTGIGAVQNVAHNLGVVPELMIVKGRSDSGGSNWDVYHSAVGATKFMYLNSTMIPSTSATQWNNTAPTATQFTLGTRVDSNSSGQTYIAYLFASLPGISKIGNYTGNGTTQTIDCSFSGGARFVIIKRTDAAGDWYVYDTARGMTTLTDPYLLLNSTAAEVATLGSVTSVSTGFAVNASILAAINTNGASYIYLAIA